MSRTQLLFRIATAVFGATLVLAVTPLLFLTEGVNAEDAPTDKQVGDEAAIKEESLIQRNFAKQIQPLINKYCLRCHNAETMKSGIRVDHLDGGLKDRQLFLWKAISELVSDEAMPPEDEPQLTAAERQLLTGWIDRTLTLARTRKRDKNGSVRRLTVAQYRNTLRDLLGLEDNLTDVLPPDGVSKDGFLNNGQTMQLSPLLIEAYFDIAERALDRCIVDEKSKPSIQNFRMDLGAAINPEPSPDKLILGAFNHLLKNDDFMVTELSPTKPFDYDPFRMRTKYRFIEGYQGNATVRGWREYDSIYHSVFACMRGNAGYPKGLPYQVVPEGLLLRPATPSAEMFKVESTYGPQANFKISLRELPDQGRFRITVNAAKYNDGLLLDPGTKAQTESTNGSIAIAQLSEPQTIDIQKAGLYQVDIHRTKSAGKPGKKKNKNSETLNLILGERHFAGVVKQPAFLVVRLATGPLAVSVDYEGSQQLKRIVITPLDKNEELAQRFSVFEKRVPRVGVHVGLRRDCGSTLAPVGAAQTVDSLQPQDFHFEGAISNFPSPDVEKDNVNYLAGIREIGVRSEYTDGRDMPRLRIRSVEFEGPFYETWPPTTHRRIFIDSEHPKTSAAYASDVIRQFASRAFRRPVSKEEAASFNAVWKRAFAETNDFHQSIKDALLVVLTSPQFLFLIENSESPKPETIDSYELASKLSYFLWNAPPDEQLLQLAAANKLHESLDTAVTRMTQDARFCQFTHEFTSQWLSLDKVDVVEVDRKRYPKLTRDAKLQLRQEPVELLNHLIQNNLPLRYLVDSDFIVANEVVASYYGLGDRTESGFEFVAMKHEKATLGGILSQAGILAGLSDGRESNPVKRGAWLARKLIAEPPDDPPPNVPALPEDDGTKLTLREKLERHRNQEGCAKCHSGIDPWGLPLEEFDAGGLFKTKEEVDPRSTLPDGTMIKGTKSLKSYLANERIDQVAFSFLKHLATYATGRSLSYNEIEFLKEKGLQLKVDGYRMQDMLRFVVKSELFLEK